MATGQECIQQEKRAISKKIDQRIEEEGDYDFSFEDRVDRKHGH